MIVLLQKTFFLFAICCITVGCYSLEKKYNYGEPYQTSPDLWTEDDPQFESGVEYQILDDIGNYIFSIPSKLILMSWRLNDHKISDATKQTMQNYIRENNLRDVKVRFNQYAPISELKRIWRNDSINPIVKYSFGLLGWFVYAVLPERLFAGLLGGDHYNPFSNSIHLYSNVPAIAIHEGGHAKDFNQRKYKTLYAGIYSIPVIGAFYHEAVATDDAIVYFEHNHKNEDIDESYKILVPAYSTYVGGSIGEVVQTPYSIVAVIPGHIYGRYKAWKFRKARRIGEFKNSDHYNED
ncbi:hypothetical protein [Leptospira sp. GIMC2001]|uniref:hypothetical protein n=1 Tax=Leptospira sp. GIMC2001 TaxID=1513297 RepID=UPI00234A2CF7|nr:hypothetical protein [Leptospira sp. GIMC2001]WCL47765.1 hypothetical protein O4O04_00475 [Leptospira sp. GIMC2001]